ncbi:DUF488 domain-containing protein [Mesorhizobium sp. B2-4-17]|uniref:DUF488 domain-containing protein n=1 Tax=Mesorhizobium sp. B2-4-17 TaxID=2589932 RepID=UPI001128A5A4|nr:DUF488 domain-containing protein [Mesorhizobium sp. B2-4-17]TPK88796.1 DUF488 domain-containing protein [Mesorhizobium sp. B2-4-17]
MALPFVTIGHSNRSLEEFVALLNGVGIDLVTDIRKVPMSRANPQFNQDRLRGALSVFRISYEYVSALGGLRGRTPGLPPDINGFWTNQSFHNYADYALSPQFHAGIELLLHQRERRCAIMCSEALWCRCHRRIVADYLVAVGETVFHILGQGRLVPARLTEGAVVQPGGKVIYPARNELDP